MHLRWPYHTPIGALGQLTQLHSAAWVHYAACMTLDDPVAEYFRAQGCATKRWKNLERMRRRADGLHTLEVGGNYYRATMKRLAQAEQAWRSARAEFLAARDRLDD